MSEKPTPPAEWADAVARLMPALMAWANWQLPDWIRRAYLQRALTNNLIDAVRKFGYTHGEVSLDVWTGLEIWRIHRHSRDGASPTA
jgi:hypothetical protein